jgi:hypothetical protein
MTSEQSGSDDTKKPTRRLSLKERIHANKGAGYGAMIGAVAGAIVMGPMAPLGAVVGGAIGGGLGSFYDRKFRKM